MVTVAHPNRLLTNSISEFPQAEKKKQDPKHSQPLGSIRPVKHTKIKKAAKYFTSNSNNEGSKDANIFLLPGLELDEQDYRKPEIGATSPLIHSSGTNQPANDIPVESSYEDADDTIYSANSMNTPESVKVPLKNDTAKSSFEFARLPARKPFIKKSVGKASREKSWLDSNTTLANTSQEAISNAEVSNNAKSRPARSSLDSWRKSLVKHMKSAEPLDSNDSEATAAHLAEISTEGAPGQDKNASIIPQAIKKGVHTNSDKKLKSEAQSMLPKSSVLSPPPQVNKAISSPNRLKNSTFSAFRKAKMLFSEHENAKTNLKNTPLLSKHEAFPKVQTNLRSFSPTRALTRSPTSKDVKKTTTRPESRETEFIARMMTPTFSSSARSNSPRLANYADMRSPSRNDKFSDSRAASPARLVDHPDHRLKLASRQGYHPEISTTTSPSRLGKNDKIRINSPSRLGHHHPEISTTSPSRLGKNEKNRINSPSRLGQHPEHATSLSSSSPSRNGKNVDSYRSRQPLYPDVPKLKYSTLKPFNLSKSPRPGSPERPDSPERHLFHLESVSPLRTAQSKFRTANLTAEYHTKQIVSTTRPLFSPPPSTTAVITNNGTKNNLREFHERVEPANHGTLVLRSATTIPSADFPSTTFSSSSATPLTNREEKTHQSEKPSSRQLLNMPKPEDLQKPGIGVGTFSEKLRAVLSGKPKEPINSNEPKVPRSGYDGSMEQKGEGNFKKLEASRSKQLENGNLRSAGTQASRKRSSELAFDSPDQRLQTNGTNSTTLDGRHSLKKLSFGPSSNIRKNALVNQASNSMMSFVLPLNSARTIQGKDSSSSNYSSLNGSSSTTFSMAPTKFQLQQQQRQLQSQLKMSQITSTSSKDGSLKSSTFSTSMSSAGSTAINSLYHHSNAPISSASSKNQPGTSYANLSTSSISSSSSSFTSSFFSNSTSSSSGPINTTSTTTTETELPDIFSESEDDVDGSVLLDWANSPELRSILLQQQKIDPDNVFGPVAPLRMEEVFKTASGSRFRPRSSSANWSNQDMLTKGEAETYAKQMGYK